MNKEALLEKFSILDDKGMTLMTPFVVSKKKKTLYLHIAKTGGSTITRILRNNGMDDMILTNKKLNHNTKLEHFKDIVDHWEEYYKFTMIRNKYDLLVSLWHYDGKPGGTFKDFVKSVLVPDKDIYDYWIDQYYLTHLNGEQIFDYIGRFDNIKTDMKTMLNNAGIGSYDGNKRENQGKYDRSIHFSKYYNDRTRASVYQKFQEEIDHFGFTL